MGQLALYQILAFCGVPFLLGFFACFVARAMGVKDTPNARSGHVDVAATAGGVSVIVALITLLGLAHIGGVFTLFSPRYLGLLALAVLMAALGFYDDMRGARALPKLLFMLIVAGASAWFIDPVALLPLPMGEALMLPAIIGVGGAMIWIIVMVNAVNFVDGANGMLVGVMSVASLALFILCVSAGASVAALWALGLLLGLLAFAPFNMRPRAQMFAGDVGALSAGFVFAISGLLLLKHTPDSAAIYALPMLVLPILIDVFMTLIRRAREGENILLAHNQHLFQRQIQAGASHLTVSFRYTIISALCAAVGVGLSFVSVKVTAAGLVLLLILGVGLYARAYKSAMKAISTTA